MSGGAAGRTGEVPGRLGGRGDAPDPVRPTQEPDAEPLDLLPATGVPVAKRAAAALVAAAVVVIATTRIRRMRNRRV
ncbi:hypothetical protein [Streptomyces canus]|uniref:hypothetical protein n=1 Tax=Streptomyces canus TaxID=58343 RepID=UPI00278B2B50|nr:hypothetical protein [Streptomyces canus]MDQ1065576.1 hypothetical protein [Streptomyces canus]